MTASLREQLQGMLGATYALERELGGGGMSRVFIATETALGRKVVVKVLPPEVAAGVKVERFKREIQFLARLHHPHIVPLLAAGGDSGLSYYVMPFMQGESLRARLIRRGTLPATQVVRTLREVASALSFAHANGIVHRDIKPDNVLLVAGSAMVTDFGVAKALSVSTGESDPNALTSLGIALGTPSYIAPEQATADPTTDHRADLYAFGAMAYEMLSGKPPFSARTPQAMLAAQISEQPVPLI
ncbi:MAG TPA: serine/threonine-protein kinase, partial [Gemmatimonadaceae bacterium]